MSLQEKKLFNKLTLNGKKAKAEKDTAVSQIDEVEEAYRSWVQAKRDKEIIL